MSKNSELLAKINDTEFLRKKKPEDLVAALDALLNVDVSEHQAFRTAVVKYQKTFWEIDPGSPNSTLDDFVQTDIFLNSLDVDNSFLKMKQAATKQRVKFSLTLDNEDVLLNILKHNPAECRAYLATLQNSPLGTITGWKPSVTPPQVDGEQPADTNSSHDILTDEAIKEIQHLAAAHRVLMVLDKTPIELLVEIKKSAEDANQAKFLEAIKKLGKEGLSDSTLIDKDLIWSKIKDKVSEKISVAVAKLHKRLREREPGDAAKLKAFDEGKDFGTLVDTIPTLKILEPCLTTEDITKLKATARSRRFEIQLQRISYLGKAAHPILWRIFTQLSAADQRSFMNNYTNNSRLSIDYLPRRVINSTNKAYIKHYLPEIDDSLIDSLVAENVRNSLFSKIHNAEAARILASTQSPFPLSAEQINSFNQALFTPEVFDDERYIALVKTIGSSLELYQAFGLNEDATSVTDQIKQTEINTQNNYNMVRYEVPLPNNIKLLEFLSAIRKNAPINELEINQIEKIFNESSDFKTFFDAIVKISPKFSLATSLNEAILNQISPALFYSIRNDIRRDIFEKNDPEKVGEILKQVKEELKTIQKSHVGFPEFRKKIAFIFAIEAVHVFNPLFQNKVYQMKKEFQELDKQCGVIVDKLKQDSIALQSAVESMSLNGDDSSPTVMKTLHTKLNIELQDIKQQLEFYEKAKGKISGKTGILDMIKAVTESRRFAYDSKGITTKVIDKAQLAVEEINTVDLNEPTVVSVLNQGEIVHFLLKENPKEGQVLCFDVHHSSRQEIETKGRFIYESSSSSSSKNLNGRFEIKQFPTPISDQPKDKLTETLNEARVNFAMAMATQILATMDGPPTKENPLRLQGVNADELGYLWTALVILGEKGSKMSFSSDALKVNSPHFNPETEKGWFGFKKQSLYNGVFKTYGALVKDTVAATGSHMDKRFNSQKAKKNIKGVEAATQFFKGKLIETKKSVDEHKKAEGPESSASSGPKSS